MLELPEAQTYAKQLTQSLGGRTVTEVEAAKSPHGFAFYSADPSAYPRMLMDKPFGDAIALGGMVEMQVGDHSLLFHDGATPRLYGPGEKRPAKHQLRIRLDDGSDLIFTVQMYGAMYAYPAGTLENPYYQLARDSASPLSGDFDAAHFEGIVRAAKPTLSAKGLLATEQRIPGLGNGCLQDILFTARVNPRTKLKFLTSADLDALYTQTKQVLAAMTAGGGRDTERTLFGEQGRYKTILSKLTAPYPCPVCGGGILRKAYMGGNVYFCPVCQPEKS